MIRYRRVCTACQDAKLTSVEYVKMRAVPRPIFYDMAVENNYAVLFSGLNLNFQVLQNCTRIAGAKVRMTNESFVYFSLTNH